MKRYQVILTFLFFLVTLQVGIFIGLSLQLPDPATLGPATIRRTDYLGPVTISSTTTTTIPTSSSTILSTSTSSYTTTSAVDSHKNEKILRPECTDDAEGPFLSEIHQLLLTIKTHSMLDIGYSRSGHMSEMFGSKFDRVVVLATNSTLLNSLQKNNSHPHAEFVFGDVATFGKSSQDKFDVVFLNMVLNELPTHEVVATMRSLEALLNDEGIGIVSTTHVDEGRGSFSLGNGSPLGMKEFNDLANGTSGVSRLRRWTKSELMEALRGRHWEVTSHVVFTYGMERGARQAWEHDERQLDRSSEEVCNASRAQMFAVRRNVMPYASKFAAPLQPSSASVKNVIFALVRGGSLRNDLDDFVESRKCLRVALRQNDSAKDSEIDDVVFHEGNVPEHVQNLVAKELSGVRFVDIRHYGAFGGLGAGSGGGICRWKPWARLRRPKEYTVGYRHMCRFMSMIWMHVLSKYEYAMRVDDDVCIHRMVHPFKFLHDSHADYVYGLVTHEGHDETVETLTPWLHEYTNNRSIIPQRPLNVNRMYFTNLFATNVSWWFDDRVRVFMHTVDRSGNIYHHRWGDAPLQTAALDMFASQERVRWVRVDYSHMSTFNEIRNGSEVPEMSTTPHVTSKTSFAVERSEKRFQEDFEVFIAPCLVANHFNLTGSPFTSHVLAMRALKAALASMAKAANITLDDYSAIELSYAAQVDLYHSDRPLPIESVQGADRRSAIVRLVTGKDRRDITNKDFTFEEWTQLAKVPCYGMQDFLNQLNFKLKIAAGNFNGL